MNVRELLIQRTKRTATLSALVLVALSGCVTPQAAAPPEPLRATLPATVPTPCPTIPIATAQPVVAPQTPLGKDPPPLQPRSVQCEALNDNLSASLQRSPDGSQFAGNGNDNYDNVKFKGCIAATRSEIRCESTWAFAHKPALLRLIAQADGLVRGELTRSDGSVAILSCLASSNDLPGR